MLTVRWSPQNTPLWVLVPLTQVGVESYHATLAMFYLAFCFTVTILREHGMV